MEKLTKKDIAIISVSAVTLIVYIILKIVNKDILNLYVMSLIIFLITFPIQLLVSRRANITFIRILPFIICCILTLGGSLMYVRDLINFEVFVYRYLVFLISCILAIFLNRYTKYRI